MVSSRLGYHCRYCKDKIKEKTFSLDHDLPSSRGGEFTLSNISVICDPCNSRKGSLTAMEFGKLMGLLNKFPPEAKKDVLRRLRAGSKALMTMFIRINKKEKP